MTPAVRVLVADDQPLVREGLRRILGAADGLTVVADVEDGLAAVTASARIRPDVVVMDIGMPVLDGIEATRRILAEQEAPPRILILTTFGLDEHVFSALRAGASGFMVKDAPAEDIQAAVHRVAKGDALLDPVSTRAVVRRFATLPSADAALAARADVLTEREREVLLLIAAGLSNAELAQRLVVSDGTVKTHVGNVLSKLGLRDRVQAVVFAYETGLVEPGGPPID